MNNQQRILTLLHRLESGNISDLEYEELIALLSLSESGVSELQARFERKGAEAVQRLKISEKIYEGKHHRIYIWIGSAAAVLLLLLAVFQFIPSEVSFETHTGEIKEITLPDGSYISMNEESRLSYHRNSFNNKRREIQFSGQGFFQIAKDSNAVFHILSSHGTTTVLGTTFYLSADPKRGSGRIDLVEGKISFVQPDREPVILAPGEMVIIQEHAIKKIPSNTNYRYWKSRQLDFQNEELTEVINQLEQILKIKIEVAGETSGCFLDSEFSDEPPDEILSVIAIAFGGTAEKTGGRSFVLRDLNCY